jgi:DNA (cytosine-5)-methyltransferase 1
MKHLGDITKISGYTAPIVDCIIGGSPCQDLSVAGKRAGLDGERSGLYIDQVRIVKEMRERDKRNGRTGVDIRPRYMVWENVPGAFSSNKGEDFRIVLEELAKIADKDAVIPMPDKGKWTSCGCIMGDGWSIAWRVLDAQFWGVPQRRRRISLIADFGGQSAPEILFVRESVSGNNQPGRAKGKGTAPHAEGSPVADHREGRADVAYTLQDREGCAGGGNGALIQTDRSAALRTQNAQVLFQPVTFSKSKRAQSDTDYETWQESDTANTLNAYDTGDVRTTEAVVIPIHDQATRFSGKRDGKEDGKGNGLGIGQAGDPMNTLTSGDRHAVVYALDRASFNQGKNAQFDFEVSGDGVNSPLVAKGPGAVCYSIDQGGGKSACNVTEGQAPTLTCTHGGEPAVCYGINGDVAGTLDSSYYKGCGMRQGVEREVVAVDCRNGSEDSVNGALQSNSAHSLNGNNVVRTRYIVRRLTPLECERLQGFPDGWTDIGEWVDSKGKRHQSSDAARYKALGNSISLPNWKWILKRISACYERDATMASLFDGIGGFPYLWEQLNGKGSCLWASEIEDFPIAVTKVRIGE